MMKKFNLSDNEEDREPTGGELFLLNYTASTSFDQIKYLSWTTAEVVGVMDEYHDKSNPEVKDLDNLSAEDLFKVLGDNCRKFVKVNFFAYFECGVVKELDYHIVEYGMLDEEQVGNDIKDCEDWLEHAEHDMLKDGYYSVDAMFRVETDGDDFRDWSWGELEHAKLYWAHTKEEVDAQIQETDDTIGNFDDLFNI